MSRDYEGKVTFLGIGGRDSTDAIEGFVERFDLPFPNAVDRNFNLFARFGVRIQDTWIFLNQDGVETARSLYQELSETELRAHLDRLVAG